ncbi:hypothetical protein PR048_008209 [Dryococelus australis]|uniref:Retroviral polymerase SH3-like domain-containing protein n=1 Tax=Dryococelus australis TaxID=614101 RepID=A0ABQ9HWH1_9NEOP|nr:hypothetical protein PR048_008209 [Dryococelus australis]
MCAELKGDIEYQECVLKNVLYIPGLTRNLVSVHKITENGGVVIFTDNGVEILNGRTKITANKTSDPNLWHIRIGHLNVDSMKKLTTLSSERGLKLDYAPAVTPQLNGRAETEQDANGENESTPFRLWPRERVVGRDITHCNSTQLLPNCGKRLDLSNLKLFGSLAYAKKLKKLEKLDMRCDKLIMVGYATNGYRLWNSEKREIKLSRDVTFVESTEVPATNSSSQEIIADTVSLVDSEETSLRLADNMEVRRNTTVLQDNVVDEPFHVFPSDQDTAKTSEMLDSLPGTATTKAEKDE